MNAILFSIGHNGRAVGVRCRLWNTKLHLKTKFDMENNTSINHENGNDANRLLAVRAYKCTHCGKVVNRESNKKWIKSYCDETGKDVRLMLVKA